MAQDDGYQPLQLLLAARHGCIRPFISAALHFLLRDLALSGLLVRARCTYCIQGGNARAWSRMLIAAWHIMVCSTCTINGGLVQNNGGMQDCLHHHLEGAGGRMP